MIVNNGACSYNTRVEWLAADREREREREREGEREVGARGGDREYILYMYLDVGMARIGSTPLSATPLLFAVGIKLRVSKNSQVPV